MIKRLLVIIALGLYIASTLRGQIAITTQPSNPTPQVSIGSVRAPSQDAATLITRLTALEQQIAPMVTDLPTIKSEIINLSARNQDRLADLEAKIRDLTSRIASMEQYTNNLNTRLQPVPIVRTFY